MDWNDLSHFKNAVGVFQIQAAQRSFTVMTFYPRTLLLITSFSLFVGCSRNENFTLCYENGQKKEEWIYKGGKSKKATWWYENGQMKEETIFKGGQKKGGGGLQVENRTKWYENGQKEMECTYDGKKDLLLTLNLTVKATWWYENGQKMRVGTYKDDKEDGKWIGWYENGQKMWDTTYKDGKVITKKEWDKDGNPK